MRNAKTILVENLKRSRFLGRYWLRREDKLGKRI
jgi:hypothetical protein